LVGLTDVLLVSAVISTVIGLILYLAMRGQYSGLRASVGQLNDIQIPQVRGRLDELARYSDVGRLKEQFQTFGQDIVNRIDSMKRLSAEELANVREDIMKQAEKRSVDAAISEVKQVAITRVEFERLRETVAKMGGREEAFERLEILQHVFDTTDLRVLSWQCKLIHLVASGLAPEVEMATMVAAGIPVGGVKDFLKKLHSHGIVESRKVESFWLVPEYEWLPEYAKEPSWVKHQLEDSVKKEKEYEDYVRKHIGPVEDGLIVISEQYELPSGRVDTFARDKTGRDVCVELKYPGATSAVLGQILKYRQDIHVKTGQDPRCIVVAPRISDKVKRLLDQNNMEYRELSF